jgi:pimeloyl-ACP methyl ester carboxylesterase
MHLSLALKLMLLLMGSFLLNPLAAADETCKPLTEKQVKKNRNKIEEAIQYAPYAIFSNNAYLRGSKALPLPEGWKETPELRIDKEKHGLALAVYENHKDDKLIEVVVAFRGTDERNDWIHNLIPFFRDQVPPAEEEFSKVLDHYKGQNMKITTTGHSLGGGLAFHMAFTHPKVNAIAFNASPVTKAGFKPNKTNKRVSIWESGDFLQIPRNMINLFRVRWKGTERIEFRFLHAMPITQHGMDKLALNMIKLGASYDTSLQALLTQYCKD